MKKRTADILKRYSNSSIATIMNCSIGTVKRFRSGQLPSHITKDENKNFVPSVNIFEERLLKSIKQKKQLEKNLIHQK